MILTLPTTINLIINKPRSQFTAINYNYNANDDVYNKKIKKDLILESSNVCSCCRRRHFVNTMTTALLSSLSLPSFALENSLSSMEMLNKIHPPRPDWYEELYASVLNNGMKSYEAEIAAYKTELFAELKGRQAKEVLEVGIGTGPNLKYYGGECDMHVVGADPNRKMEKYARGAAEASGLSPENFKFVHAVGEALPLSDASVDAVIGTLVMCSVKDVNTTLEEIKRVLKPGGMYLFIEHVAAKDGTSLRLLQNILNPLQQLLADGCHLTRDTGRYIADAGFSEADIKTTVISNASFINPHVYGVARK